MKKAGLVALVLIMAMGILGVGFAAWQQTLTINGSVNTGYLQVQFAEANAIPDINQVATGSAVISSSENGLNDVLTCTIDNAYPGAVITFVFFVTNTGTVPVTGLIEEGTIDPVLGVSYDFAGTNMPPNSNQPGQVTVVVGDDAEMNSPYSFSLNLSFTQFSYSSPV